MSQNDPTGEPLSNVALESALLGLRMALTPEEAQENRARFLDTLRLSTLAVPTLRPVAVGPDGAVLPGSEISLLVVTAPDGTNGVPAFTTLGALRAALPQSENGMFLTGGDLGNILGSSPHTLFVHGPDADAAVATPELQQMAFVTHQMALAEQQFARGNEPLEQALRALQAEPTAAAGEAVIRAFLGGFCRYPVAGPEDEEADCVVLSQESAAGNPVPQELSLLTLNGALPCFTGEDAQQRWDTQSRSAVPLPGQMVVPLAMQAEVAAILVNPGSPDACALQIADGHLVVSPALR